MFFELRTYDLTPGKAPVYLEFFRTFGVGLVTRHLPMAGYWMAETGRLNRIEHLWVYESFDERDACRASLSKDRAWMEEFVPTAFRDVIAQENRFMALEHSSGALDAVVAGRRDPHPNQSADTPMFGPDLNALGVSTDPSEPENVIARFRVLSGRAPGTHVTLSGGSFDDLTRHTSGFSTHEIIRPLSLSPLGGARP